jgi:hypothetical protein
MMPSVWERNGVHYFGQIAVGIPGVFNNRPMKRGDTRVIEQPRINGLPRILGNVLTPRNFCQ